VTEDGLRARKKRDVFERLFEAAMARFEADGYDAASVASICADAGVAKGTFFNHFPTKEHLLFEWYARVTADALDRRDPAPGSLGDRLAAEFGAQITRVISNGELWRAKLRLAALHAELRAVEHDADAVARARAAQLIADAQAAGEVRASVDPQEAAGLFLAQLTGTVREWVNAEGAFDLVERVDQRIRAFAKLLA